MPSNLDKYAQQYFTGVQASIFVGDIWCDEVFGIQFSASQSILPIYGYASYHFDAVARGKSIVQGFFEVNFIDEGYLYAVIEEAYKRMREGDPDEFQRTQNDVIEEKIKLLETVTSTQPTSGSTAGEVSRQDTMAELIDRLSELTVEDARDLKDRLSAPEQVYSNVIYHAMPFHLKGYFGNPEHYGTEYGAYKEIKNCFLIANEMMVSVDDQPVRERYSFMARSHI